MDSRHIITTREELRERVYKDVMRYFDASSGAPLPYRKIAGSLSKIAARVGVDLIDLIEGDERLLLKYTKKGARVLFPASGYEMEDWANVFGSYGIML